MVSYVDSPLWVNDPGNQAPNLYGSGPKLWPINAKPADEGGLIASAARATRWIAVSIAR